MQSTATTIFKVAAKLTLVELYEEAACDLLVQHPRCLSGENPDREMIATHLLEPVLAQGNANDGCCKITCSTCHYSGSAWHLRDRLSAGHLRRDPRHLP